MKYIKRALLIFNESDWGEPYRLEKGSAEYNRFSTIFDEVIVELRSYYLPQSNQRDAHGESIF